MNVLCSHGILNFTFSFILMFFICIDLQQPMQPVPITTNVGNSNPPCSNVYSNKFVSDLQQVGGFLLVLWFPPQNKTDHHDIQEILLIVALNSIHYPPLCCPGPMTFVVFTSLYVVQAL